MPVQNEPWPTSGGIRSDASNTKLFVASAPVIAVANAMPDSVS